MLDALTTSVTAAFVLALLGGVHCAGMCGGFTGVLQLQRAPQLSPAKLASGYHAGRLTSYMLAGMLAGLLGGAVYATDVLALQVLLLCAGNAMLLAIGASMLGKRAWLARLEPVGARLWRAIAPFARKVFPPRSWTQSYVAGLLWGWIPCGMVYAALPLALTAGHPVSGAVVMLAFGLGTLPTMVTLDVAASKWQGSNPRASARGGALLAGARSLLRPVAGLAILVFGVSGLAYAAKIAGAQDPTIAALASICHR